LSGPLGISSPLCISGEPREGRKSSSSPLVRAVVFDAGSRKAERKQSSELVISLLLWSESGVAEMAIHSSAVGTIDQLTAETPDSNESRLTTCSTTSLRRPDTVSTARISMLSEFCTSPL
jgi:hypothetical protein